MRVRERRDIGWVCVMERGGCVCVCVCLDSEPPCVVGVGDPVGNRKSSDLQRSVRVEEEVS